MGKLDIIKEFNRSCDEVVNTSITIASKYTEDLDNVIFDVQELLQDRDSMSVDELTKYIALIPVMIYDLIDKMQVLGVRSDLARMQRRAEFNRVYIEQEYGTVPEKTSIAQTASENEQFIEDMYNGVYKLCTRKIETADMLHSSLKKVLQWKLTELEVTRNDMLANRR